MADLTINRTQLFNKTTAGVSNPFPFVNRATADVDCNVAKTSECVELVNGVQLTSQYVRLIGKDLKGGTGNNLAARVFRDQGLVAGTDYVMFGGADIQFVRDLLAEGWHVVGHVDHGVMIDSGAPVGSFTYRGIHAIGLQGWFLKDGKRFTRDHDPLFDGRIRRVPGKGIFHYPFGRQDVKFSLIRDAMSAYAGEGKAAGYAVRPR